MEKKKVIHLTKKTEPIKPGPIDIDRLHVALWHLGTVKWALIGMGNPDHEVEREDLNHLLVDVSDIEDNLKRGLYPEEGKGGGSHE